MAKDGIHAVLVVFSVRTRFTHEEQEALLKLQTLFGSKIINYMIVVFSGGDELEENDETLEDYLGREYPEALKVTHDFLLQITFLFTIASFFAFDIHIHLLNVSMRNLTFFIIYFLRYRTSLIYVKIA